MPLESYPEKQADNLERPHAKLRSKMLQAILFGVALASASPAFAVGAETFGKNDLAAESSPAQTEINTLLQQFPTMSLLHQQSIKEVYERTTPDKQALMLQILAEPYSFPKYNPGDDILLIQHKMRELAESGELAPKRKGGVILPADTQHSGKNTDVEYSDDTIVGDGKPRITIENASAQQIQTWLNALKNPQQWAEDLAKETKR